MRRRPKRAVDHDNAQRWLLTYADLITLLLAFFIVMYSMSRLDAEKFGRVADAFNGVLKGSQRVISVDELDRPGAGFLIQGELRMLEQQIDEKIRTEQLDDQIKTIQDERGLVIRVMESAAFDAGSADLKPQMYSILNLLTDQLQAMDNHLRVEGHTDNIPIHTTQFPSNWELSTTRATRVVRYLVGVLQLDPKRISALGYGEFRPIASNESGGGRARNRRVDFIVLADNSLEPEAEPSKPTSPLALADSLLRQ
jgi:chemotaxis protein MotB